MLVAKDVEHKRVMCESKRQAALCKVRVLVVGMLHFSHSREAARRSAQMRDCVKELYLRK